MKGGRARRAPAGVLTVAVGCLAVSPRRGDSSGLVPTAVTSVNNALADLGICSELASGLYALTATRE